MKVTSQMFSLTSLMPMFCPANTVLKLTLRRPMQMRPHLSDGDRLIVEGVVQLI
jgi:hypothetical protein